MLLLLSHASLAAAGAPEGIQEILKYRKQMDSQRIDLQVILYCPWYWSNWYLMNSFKPIQLQL